MQAISQPAYVLHTRAYRNSSAIVDFFTPDYGRISGVVKSVYGSRKANQQLRGLLQSMQCLQIQWLGKRDLKTVISVEARGAPALLAGSRLCCALYVNELLIRLLHAQDAHEALFNAYDVCLKQLQANSEIEGSLRDFELFLLADLGYGIDFTIDSEGAEIAAERYYRFEPSLGFAPLVLHNKADAGPRDFSGLQLQTLASQDFTLPATRQTAKRLTRLALKPLLGEKPLQSRKLFQSSLK